MELSKTLEITK